MHEHENYYIAIHQEFLVVLGEFSNKNKAITATIKLFLG